MTNTRKPDRALLGTAALVFMASTAVTILWCGSMSAMPGMEMPGGWTMSMAWMRMPGQSWSGAAATFIGMWTVMMVAMMLPVLVPLLMQYRRALNMARVRQNRLTGIVALAYFTAWTMFGLIIYPLGVGFAEVAMHRPELASGVPFAAGVVVMLAGAAQFTAWKSNRLACCRELPSCPGAQAAKANAAWRCGFRLGWRCIQCCAGLTAILLVIGVMTPGAMALVAVAVAAERLATRGRRVARVIGAGLLVLGLWLFLRAASQLTL